MRRERRALLVTLWLACCTPDTGASVGSSELPSGSPADAPAQSDAESFEGEQGRGDHPSMHPCGPSRPRACYEAALRLSGPDRGQRALPLFERACDLGEMDACYALARLLEDGKGVEHRPDQARELLQRACRAQQQAACDALGH
ncbi:MAG: hypothetical protein OXU20_08850 [Myxococcales bacterium]|nr:hypothetical protein [Myxococcales bacterium]